MNALELKNKFPIFSYHKTLGKQLIYLDSAATTQKPQCVIDALRNFYATANANINRGLYDLAEEATAQYEAARAVVADFLHAAHPSEIVFTKGATEGINFIAQTWALHHLKAGDSILLTDIEHHANLLPWQWVAEKTGAYLDFISYNPDSGYLDNPTKKLTQRTKLAAVTGDSNIVGSIWPNGELERFIQEAHSNGTKVLIDGAQSVMHHAIDLQALQPDFFVFSGHKLLGPMGIGVLYINAALHDKLEPYQRGGSMIHSATYQSARWAQAPAKFEAGTPPVADAIGLAQAISFINEQIVFPELQNHEALLCKELVQALQSIQGISIVGCPEQLKMSGYLVSFSVKGIHHHDLAAYLASSSIAVRAGHLCAQPFIEKLGLNGVIRVSFGCYNTVEDVQFFLEVLTKGLQKLMIKG